MNAWICYDFKERRVIPTSYTVKASQSAPGYYHLKSWVIEVSNDRYSWTEIDRRDNNNDVNGDYATANFKISNVPSESFRCFRLRQSGKNHYGSHGFMLAAMEVFGTLVVEKVEKTRPSKQEFVYHADREGLFAPPLAPPKLDGVIAHLTREFCGNVHDKGVVNVTASSFVISDIEDEFHPKNAADLGADSWCLFNSEKNTWICYDFKERRVIPTSYSVVSVGWRRGAPYLKSWVIEVSNDKSSWMEIDRRDNDDGYVDENFTIAKVPSESFRFFRLRQIGQDQSRSRRTFGGPRLSSLEIFGTLFEK